MKHEANLPCTLLFEEDGIYQVKDYDVYPVSHPDLSTQPSILPQRFGNTPVKEVLIAHGRECEIPENAVIIEAWSFNTECCAPAVCKRSGGKWSISNAEGMVPLFTRVCYFDDVLTPYND